MQESSNLKFINTKSLKFYHNEKGVIASYKKRKFILGCLLMFKDDANLSDNDYLNIAKNTYKFHCGIRQVPLHPIDNFYPVSSEKKVNDFTPFYKYVSNEVFENFISRGIFQLGTIEQYRTIENIKQRDEFEGHSCLNIKVNNHVISTICSSGFNYLIFCATKTSGSESHKDQFGEKELYFPKVRAFAETIAKKINARRFFVQNVEYNTLKLYINKTNIDNPNIVINNSILTPHFFDVLNEHMLYPSLFVKPEPFQKENEVRIVFEMPKDIDKPYRFECKELLKHIVY